MKSIWLLERSTDVSPAILKTSSPLQILLNPWLAVKLFICYITYDQVFFSSQPKERKKITLIAGYLLYKSANPDSKAYKMYTASGCVCSSATQGS